MTYPFDNINNKNKLKLLKLLETHSFSFPKNKTILSMFKNDNIICIITKGSIEITSTDYNGNTVVIEELYENDVFGTRISSISSNEIDVITKEETEIIIVDYERIINCNANNKEFYNQFIKNMFIIFNNKIEEKNNRIQIITKKTIRNKLLEYFNLIAKKKGTKSFYIPYTFTKLADYLSVDRSAMTRELKYLKEDGIIKVKGKRITILY